MPRVPRPDRDPATPSTATPARDEALALLRRRFDAHPERHRGIEWSDVAARFDGNAAALRTLQAMEASGGEPDVVGAEGERLLVSDCAAETPAGRRSLCYDRAALDARKEAKPAGSAVEAALAMGVELLDEERYRALQALGDFDCKTSSWIATPVAVREQGGALFGDRRYGRVFTYHNGAQSYYAVRGWRGLLRV